MSAHSSPFDEAVCAVLDGFGEGSTTAFFRYEAGQVRRIAPEAKSSRAGLGFFYSRLCKACGFDPIRGEEWKVMGLAAYGEHDPELHAQLRALVRVEGLRFVPSADRHRGWDDLYRQFSDVKDPIGTVDLAHTGQQVFCELFAELLCNLHARFPSDQLVLGGGCALNSAFTGRVLEMTPFSKVHVSSAPADDGNAVGAALLAYAEEYGRLPAKQGSMNPYLGDRLRPDTIRNMMRFSGLEPTATDADTATERAAQLLADGKIVACARGRAEFGPRALGNRSILADPRRADIKAVINERVKFREAFRPFAPSILDEHGGAYFEDYQHSRYMERALRFRDEVKERIPGVVHVDGTGRLQSVTREWNPAYYALIHRFYELTDVPILLNTSFNVMGKPIVHSVEDALAVFFTSGIDALLFDDLLFEK